MERLCGQYDRVLTTSGRYNVSANQWGADGSGKQCLMVEPKRERSDGSTSFAVTWNWEASPEKVHTYPNVNLNLPLLPVQLDAVRTLKIDAAWSLAPGSESTGMTDVEALQEVNAKTNVALDFFLDKDPARSMSTTLPSHEIMIWFATYGEIYAIGFGNGVMAEQTLAGTNFKLYSGTNDNGQQVYSWLAQTNFSSVTTDVSPLVNFLWHNGNSSLDSSFYIGVMQFGTETFHVKSGSEVTFNASRVFLDVESSRPPPAAASAASRVLDVPVVLFTICFLLIVRRLLR